MVQKQKNYIITDVANDDLQAIYYLSKKMQIDGIIIETGVTDFDNAIKNLKLFLILFVKKNIKIYLANTEFVTVTPYIWKVDSAYALFYMEDLFYKIYGPDTQFYNCKKKISSYKEINFDNAIIICSSRATTLSEILNKFKIKDFYAFLGISGISEDLPYEFNSYCDYKAYKKVLEYKQKNNIGHIFTIEEITPDKVEKAKKYCLDYPFLIDIIMESSRPTWQFWDLVFVSKYF